MPKLSAKIPLHESPWYSAQNPEHVARFEKYLSDLGGEIADFVEGPDSRTLDNFLQGAIGEMDTLNIATPAYEKTKTSSFRFKDQKDSDEDVTIFLVMDSSRIDAQSKLFELVIAAAQKEWVRAKDKKKPITLFLNEISNVHWKGLTSLLSWCRAYNLKLIFYLQNLFGFEAKHGKFAKEALLAEADISLFLQGQTHPETLAYLEDRLGGYSYVDITHNGNRTGQISLDGYSYSEQSRPLMSKARIAQIKGHGILFLGKNKPALVELPSIASLAPFRSWQGINPFYGAPYRARIRYRFWRYYPWMPAVLLGWLSRSLRRRRRAVKTAIFSVFKSRKAGSS